jgi:hypothetical protein
MEAVVNEEFQPPLPQHRARARRPPTVPTLDHNGEDSEYEEEDDEEGYVGDQNDIRNMYWDATWKKERFSFTPPPREITGCGGPREDYHRMPTFLMLFRLFWPDSVLRKIVTETNRYATTEDEDGVKPGGPRWKPFTIQELKAFFAISMLIGLRKQPNVKTYWQRQGSFFHCPVISQIFTRARFQALTKCLHITNHANYVSNRLEEGYDHSG